LTDGLEGKELFDFHPGSQAAKRGIWINTNKDATPTSQEATCAPGRKAGSSWPTVVFIAQICIHTLMRKWIGSRARLARLAEFVMLVILCSVAAVAMFLLALWLLSRISIQVF
jgi:hypothetical protein